MHQNKFGAIFNLIYPTVFSSIRQSKTTSYFIKVLIFFSFNYF
nr:MAG TPA: hypothetical protein [Crassvirales sp.]